MMTPREKIVIPYKYENCYKTPRMSWCVTVEFRTRQTLPCWQVFHKLALTWTAGEDRWGVCSSCWGLWKRKTQTQQPLTRFLVEFIYNRFSCLDSDGENRQLLFVAVLYEINTHSADPKLLLEFKLEIWTCMNDNKWIGQNGGVSDHIPLLVNCLLLLCLFHD